MRILTTSRSRRRRDRALPVVRESVGALDGPGVWFTVLPVDECGIRIDCWNEVVLRRKGVVFDAGGAVAAAALAGVATRLAKKLRAQVTS